MGLKRCWVMVGSASLAALASVPACAQPGPPESYVTAGCGPGNGIYTDAGPAGTGLQLSCDKQATGVHVLYGPYDFQGVSSVNTGLEMGGAVDASASVRMRGGEPYVAWSAGAGGHLGYFVGLSGLGEAPPLPLAAVPLKFSASGEAHVTDGDGGSFDIAAWLDGQGVQRHWEGVGSHSDSFSTSTSVSFATTPNSYRAVLISARCQVSTWSAGAGSGSCVAAADPVFSFDQAAFDASMGPDTFQLDRYFRIDLSPGVVAVPEPSSWISMAAGLFAVAARFGSGHRRRDAAEAAPARRRPRPPS